MPMRRLLDRLYALSGASAAAFVVAIALVVLAQVGCNAIDALIKAFGGAPIGLVIPSYAEFAGFFLAAASFLALAHTLRHGDHIRVLLVRQKLPPRMHRPAEFGCLAAGLLVSAYFAWYTWLLVAESIEYNDLSPGIIPVPLWIPQGAMALGLTMMVIAMLDDLVRIARGEEASYAGREAGASGHE